MQALTSMRFSSLKLLNGFRFVDRAPTLLKYFIVVIFLLNVRSWPLGWHFRIFRPVFLRRLQQRWLRLKLVLSSPEVKAWREDQWLESIMPVGAHPFTAVVSYKTWASLDESDFNGHLSNSSYAKTLDAARFKTAVDMFPNLFRAGGWIPLAATHYHFIREIPMFTGYEVRTSIGAWDSKWLYIVSKYVRRPKARISSPKESPSPQSILPSENIPSLRTAGPEEMSESVTPFPAITPKESASTEDTTIALNAVAGLIAAGQPDGAVLHTVAVSQICFKVGRITVPPALVLALNGFAGDSTQSFSHSNPPPHWIQARSVASVPAGGSMKKAHQLMKGGWRDVPEAERWWDQALAGAAEQNATNLSELEKLRRGLDSASTIG